MRELKVSIFGTRKNWCIKVSEYDNGSLKVGIFDEYTNEHLFDYSQDVGVFLHNNMIHVSDNTVLNNIMLKTKLFEDLEIMIKHEGRSYKLYKALIV